MIAEFVKAWDENKDVVKANFEKKMPTEYSEIVKEVVKILADSNDWRNPDPDLITEIDHGDYQGTLLYIIATDDYQPSDFWYVKVSYGSCSGCDTLEEIRSDGDYYDDDGNPSLPNEGQVKDLMTLALHIVQGLKKLGDDEV
jgi:hypothetical protein